MRLSRWRVMSFLELICLMRSFWFVFCFGRLMSLFVYDVFWLSIVVSCLVSLGDSLFVLSVFDFS